MDPKKYQSDLWPGHTPLGDEAREAIIMAMGRENVFDKGDILKECSKDESGLHYTPELVVKADDPEKISQLMRLANKYDFPVTPRGAGTGLSAGCLAGQGGVVLCLEGMNRIISIDTRNLIAEVEAGVITSHLAKAARGKGLFYPPDPASLDTCTLGGNAATNAGGPACVKYGVTREYVLGLEAVLPTGEIIKTGVKTKKGVVGYDMTHLLVGSEGTLGIITKLILKLIPLPEATAGQAAVFPSLHDAMEAITQILVRGHLPSALEFLDAKCLALVGDLLPFGKPREGSAMIYLECDGQPELVRGEIDKIKEICLEMGATELLPALTDEDRAGVWNVRRQVSLRINESAPVNIPEDVAVPIGRIADLIDTLPAIEEKYGLGVYAFGHAGDGNIHISITAGDTRRMDQVDEGIEQIIRQVLALEGTISGEHGVGLAKAPFLPLEIGEKSRQLQMGIKRLFDPKMVLNPGKIFI